MVGVFLGNKILFFCERNRYGSVYKCNIDLIKNCEVILIDDSGKGNFVS